MNSAAGSTVAGRISTEFQAVLPLRGKVLNVEKASLEQIVNSPSIQRIIQSFGTGFGKTFDISKLRYNKIIILTDADVDGLHIKALLIVLLHKYMRDIITKGYLYAAIPPLYRAIYNKNQSIYLRDDNALQQWKNKNQNLNFELQRFKGIGEMSVDEIKETILDPSKRILKRILINDVLQAEETLKICMGSDTTL